MAPRLLPLVSRTLPALLLWLAASAVQAAEWRVDAADWARPRSGEGVLAMEPVASAVRALLAADQGSLSIGFPGGDEGALWAGELRAWLVALGIESSRIRLLPGAARENVLTLRVHPAPGSEQE